MTHSILIIETDKSLQKNLKELFFTNHFFVHIVEDEVTAFAYIKKNEPDLIIFDVDEEKGENIALYEKIKDHYKDLPVVVIANQNTLEKIKNKIIESDEIIAKPLDDHELLKQIRSRLSRQKVVDTFLKIADLELDSSNMEVRRHGKAIQLTPQEFKLLQYFMSNKGKILTREMILSRIWMYSTDIKTRVVDVYIGYLRKKIDSHYSKKLLHSIRGFGYVIKE